MHIVTPKSVVRPQDFKPQKVLPPKYLYIIFFCLMFAIISRENIYIPTNSQLKYHSVDNSRKLLVPLCANTVWLNYTFCPPGKSIKYLVNTNNLPKFVVWTRTLIICKQCRCFIGCHDHDHDQRIISRR